MNQARVAVLIPAYQAQATLDRALASIPDQPWVQTIVVDDGSAPALQPKHRFHQASFMLLREEANQGVAGALGLASRQLADSIEYLIELDADDYFLPGGLQAMWQGLQQNPGADLCWGGHATTGPARNPS